MSPGTILTLTNVTLANGRSTNFGGAVFNEGTIFAESCQFVSNAVIALSGTAGTNGTRGTLQGIVAQPGGAGQPGGSVEGGAVINYGNLALRYCSFGTNSALGGKGGDGGSGGSSAGPPGYLAGAGGAAAAGGHARGGSIANYGTLSIDGCSFSNSFTRDGGNPGSLALLQTAAPGAVGAAGTAQGGAVFTLGQTTISNSLFLGNTCAGGNSGNGAFFVGPYSYPGTNGGLASGGAIYFGSNSLIANCTLSTNIAQGGRYDSVYYINYAFHGGDAIGGALASAGSLQAVSLTLHGNAALGGLRYTGDTNGNSLGGSIANTGGVFQIVNSILAGGFSNNCFGVITDLGHNLSSDVTPAWTSGTSLNNTDPLLLPLGNYGGPTLTMALHAGSPALNTADCALAPATDQRGFPRPDGPGCDIGAYEGASAPALQIFRVNSATNVLRWLAKSGRNYRVDGATNLNSWSPYATNLAATNGVLDVAVPVSAPGRFFRLLAE